MSEDDIIVGPVGKPKDRGAISIGDGAKAKPGEIAFACDHGENQLVFKSDGSIRHNGITLAKDEDIVEILRSILWRALKPGEITPPQRVAVGELIYCPKHSGHVCHLLNYNIETDCSQCIADQANLAAAAPPVPAPRKVPDLKSVKEVTDSFEGDSDEP